MKMLPYDFWTVESPLDVPTIVAGMEERIEPTQWFRTNVNQEHSALEGRVHSMGFSVHRVIHYRNSFLPILYGKFTTTSSGTTIRIRMMPHPLVIMFMLPFLGFFALFIVFGFLSIIRGEASGELIPIGFIGGSGVLMLYGGFFAETKKTKNLISEVLLELHKELK